jgi:hypothetical protein
MRYRAFVSYTDNDGALTTTRKMFENETEAIAFVTEAVNTSPYASAVGCVMDRLSERTGDVMVFTRFKD